MRRIACNLARRAVTALTEPAFSHEKTAFDNPRCRSGACLLVFGRSTAASRYRRDDWRVRGLFD